jgi:hypothetical protein
MANCDVDAQLFEGTMHAEGAEAWVLLQPLDLGHGREVHRPEPRLGAACLLIEHQPAFFDPATQDGMHRLPARAQVGADALGIPAVDVQGDHRPLGRLGRHFMVGWEAAHRPRRRWAVGQDALHGVRTGPALKDAATDGGDLVGPEGRVLRLEVDDELAHIRGQRRRARPLRRSDIGKEADHAELAKALDALVQRAARDARL